MTKLRTPDSVEEAVTQAKVLLTRDVIAAALSSPAAGVTVSVSLVDKWCDELAPQRIGLHQALAIEALLLKSGHTPVFSDLFARLLTAEPSAEEGDAPIVVAMRAVSEAAQVMDRIDEAMADGHLSPQEVISCRAAVEKLQKRCAKLRRTLFFKPPTKR